MTFELTPANCLDCDSGLVFDLSGAALVADACPKCKWNISGGTNKADRLNWAEIPPRFWKACTTESLDLSVQQWLADFESGKPRNLFITGPTLSGKTTASVAMIERFLARGIGCLYVDCVKYLEDVREVIREQKRKIVDGHRTGYMEAFRRKLHRMEVVVIDNVGEGGSTLWCKDRFLELLNSRKGKGQVTIFCSSYGSTIETSHEGRMLSDVLGIGIAERVLESKVVVLHRDVTMEPVKPRKPEADVAKVISIIRNTPLKKDETACLDILARDGLFKLVATQERKKLSSPSTVNPGMMVEETRTTERLSYSGHHIVLDGPVLDYDDRNVLLAIYKLYWGMDEAIDGLKVSLRMIARELGVTPNRNSLNAIKGSLLRLSRVNVIYFEMPPINVKNEDSAWISGKFLDVKYDGKGRGSCVAIKFGRLSLVCFGMRSFFSVKPRTLRKLSNYAQGIYCFLLSHRSQSFRMSLSKWRSVLAVDEGISPKHFKHRMQDALKELQSKGYLWSKSHVGDDGLIYTFLRPPRIEFLRKVAKLNRHFGVNFNRRVGRKLFKKKVCADMRGPN